MKNPILDEIHETRARLLAESGGTVASLVARLQAEERSSGRTIRDRRRDGAGRPETPAETLASAR